MSREEVMDGMYGRALPLPRAPAWGQEEGRGAAVAVAAAAASAPSSSSSAASSAPLDLCAWARRAEFDVAPGMGVAGPAYAWTQGLSHVEAAVRLPRACADARRRRAAERWRLKAAAADVEEGEDEGEGEEERLRQPRLAGLAGRDVRVELTATALRVAVADGGARRAPGAAEGGGGGGANANDDDDDEVLLCGELEADVKASECTWYIDDDAGVVRLSLLKRCRRGHYDAAPAQGGGGAARASSASAAASASADARPRTNADTFWRGLLRGAPASMRLPDGPPPVAYYSSAYEADD
jgi:hypothetical protein